MFTSDKLTYIEMPKTGSIFIVSILSQLFEGERIGVHNAATPAQFKSSNYFISSIRDPWKWYVSFWAFSAQGSGDLYRRHAKRGVKEPAKVFINTKSVSKSLKAATHEVTKDTDLWRGAYDRTNEIDSFRKWLHLVHDPQYSIDMGEGYGDTKLSSEVGYMTFRYLSLCCRNSNLLYKPNSINNYADLVRFDRENCYIDYFIRQESLRDSLYEALQKVRPLSEEERNLIFESKKRNPSKKAHTLAEYYTDELIELVFNRDRLIIDKFNYLPPS